MNCILDKNTSVADYVWLPIRFDGEKVLHRLAGVMNNRRI